MARGSRLHLPPIKQEHIIDCSEWRVKSKEYLEPEALAVLGKYGNNKERVLNYIQSLPPFMKRELVNQALSKQTPLGKFLQSKGAYSNQNQDQECGPNCWQCKKN